MMIQINQTEKKIFDLLKKVVQDSDAELRAAGGWVRDKLMGRESQDIDISVNDRSGLELANCVYDHVSKNRIGQDHYPLQSHVALIKANPDKSKHLETAVFPIFGISIDFVQLRKETYEDTRVPTIQVATAYEDAHRRDFTVNALFYNLHSESVEDHTGRGLADLDSGILRTPLDPIVTFLQDPLRILRAIRFATKFNFQLHDSIVEAAKDPRVQKAFMEKLSHERIWKEMVGTLETTGFKRGFLIGPDPARGAHLMNQLGIRDLLFTLSEKERKAVGVRQDETAHWDADQNSKHHNLSIWEHTLESMQHLVHLGRDEKIDNDSPEMEEIVRHLSILLHDIGKCDLCSRQVKEDGTFSYLGHAAASANMAEYILDEKFKAPKNITQRVRNIVFNHMRLHVLENKPSDTSLRRVMREMGDDWKNLVYHSIADALGKTDAKEDAKYRYMLERATHLKIEQGGNKVKRPIDGNIVMSELGLKPGPAVKVVLAALDDVLLENPAMTAEEALVFIRTLHLPE